MKAPVDLTGMALFVKIVERGSLSAASRTLSIPKATVSRELAALEKRLGAPLLHRSTRALALTDMGRRYFERIAPIVRDAEQAQVEAMSEHAAPSGLLRVTAPVAYGQHVLAPRLFQFLQLHPAVRLDLRLADEQVNVISSGFDLAIRLGPLSDSELVGRRLGSIERVIVAAPSYLSQHPEPQTPADLAQHRVIVTRPDMDHWTFGAESVRLVWRMSTGNMLVTRDAVLAGMGIALLPTFLAEAAIRDHQLVRLLLNWPMSPVELTALHARFAVRSLAAAALVSYLVST